MDTKKLWVIRLLLELRIRPYLIIIYVSILWVSFFINTGYSCIICNDERCDMQTVLDDFQGVLGIPTKDFEESISRKKRSACVSVVIINKLQKKLRIPLKEGVSCGCKKFINSYELNDIFIKYNQSTDCLCFISDSDTLKFVRRMELLDYKCVLISCHAKLTNPLLIELID